MFCHNFLNIINMHNFDWFIFGRKVFHVIQSAVPHSLQIRWNQTFYSFISLAWFSQKPVFRWSICLEARRWEKGKGERGRRGEREEGEDRRSAEPWNNGIKSLGGEDSIFWFIISFKKIIKKLRIIHSSLNGILRRKYIRKIKMTVLTMLNIIT